MASNITLFLLPEEITLQVTEHLFGRTLVNFASSCQTAYRIASPVLDSKRRELARKWTEPDERGSRGLTYTKIRPNQLAPEKTSKDVKEFNRLLEACEARDMNYLTSFLAEKRLPQSPFAKPNRYFSPFEAASRDTAVVKILLDAGAELPDDFNLAARLVCMNGLGQETLDLLAQQGLDLTMISPRSRNTFLHYACQNSHPASVIQLLIRNGLNPYTQNSTADSPVAIALEKYKRTKRHEQLEVIRALISFTPEPQGPCEGFTNSHPLHYAARMGDVELTKLLLNHGADVNARESRNLTPLCIAGSEACAVALLGAGADFSTPVGREPGGVVPYIPLQYAMEHNHAIVRPIFDACRAQFGMRSPATMFVAAAGLGEVSMMETLLPLIKKDPEYIKYNADRALLAAVQAMTESVHEAVNELWDRQSDEADYPRYFEQLEAKRAECFATESAHEKAIRFLLEHTPDIDPWSLQTPHDDTALGLAMVCGSMRIAETLLSRVPTKGALDSSWHDILAIAVLSGPDLVRAVLDRIPGRIRPCDIRRILENAVLMGHPNICRLLLDRLGSSAELEVDPEEDIHLLLLAAGKGNYEVVQMLIECRVDINAADRVGSTALSQAITNNHPKVAMLLISSGCDVARAIEVYGNTSPLLEDVASYGHAKLLELMLGKAGDSNADDRACGEENMLIAAASGGHVDVVKFLLETRRIPTHYLGNHGKTALMCAAIGGYTDVVGLLLDAGADIHARDDDGRDAFFSATAETGLCTDKKDEIYPETVAGLEGQLQVARILAAKGANLNNRDQHGRSAFSYLAEKSQIEMMKFFISELGVDVTDVDSSGRSPLWYACSTNSVTSIKLLLEAGADKFKADVSGKIPLHDANDEVVKVLYSTL
ncbi:ankyrin repeat-containing domain protein [Aspergillus heterothallicus]